MGNCTPGTCNKIKSALVLHNASSANTMDGKTRGKGSYSILILMIPRNRGHVSWTWICSDRPMHCKTPITMPLVSLPCQIRFLHSFILLPINTVCSHEQNEFLSCSFCDVIGQVDSHTARSWIIKPEVTLCKLNHVETTSRKFTLSRELF